MSKASSKLLPSNDSTLFHQKLTPRPEFRLFSAVQPVSLSTTETYAVTTNPRLAPLPPAVRERIACFAADAAVSLDDITSCAFPSRLPEKDVEEFTLRPGQDVRAKHEKGKGAGKGGKTTGCMPPAFVAIAPVGSESKCVALPHLKLDSCLLEHEQDQENGQMENKRKRRRRAYREFPPAQYWHPAEGEEERSAGYFYGWSV